jgi:hypothetical protein
MILVIEVHAVENISGTADGIVGVKSCAEDDGAKVHKFEVSLHVV